MGGPPRMAGEPSAHLGMLVDGVMVEDCCMHELAGRHRRLDAVQEMDEFLVVMPRHALADHRVVEDIERGKQGGCAVPDVIVGHRPGPAPLERQTWLCAVERLNLRLLVDRANQTLARRVEIEPYDSAHLAAKAGYCTSLKRRTRCGCRQCAAQIRCTEPSDTPVAAAIARPVQRAALPSGSASVS